MKPKKPHRKNKHKHASRPRNAATSAPASAPRSRPRLARATPPHWKTIAAAVAGGAGSAALGGLLVNQQILSPEVAGIGLMLGGGATAYFADGMPRVVGSSVAAAGAGQYALALMNKRALKGHGSANANASPPPQQAAQLAPPSAASPTPRSSANGGVVVDNFRDALSALDDFEDGYGYEYGPRDAAPDDDGEPIVIDLDEAA